MRKPLLTVIVVGAIGLSIAAPARADDSLYQALGERAGIERLSTLATDFYLKDPRIKDQFDNINMDRLRARLADHLCVVVGGPCTYAGRDMAAAHKGLHLRNADFNALAEDLQTAMEQLGVPFRTQSRVLALLAPMQHQIVTR